MTKKQGTIDDILSSAKAELSRLFGDSENYPNEEGETWSWREIEIVKAQIQVAAIAAAEIAAQAAEIKQMRGQWQTFAEMMEPIVSFGNDCLCAEPPHAEHEDETRRDASNPSCHSQYCPMYLHAYAVALANGTPTPD